MPTSERVIGGTLWWLLDRAVFALTSLAAQVLIARRLGVVGFGDLSVIVAAAGLALPLIHAGISGLVSRALLERPETELSILQVALALRLVFAVMTVLVGTTLVWLGPGSHNAWIVVLLVAQIGIAFQVIEYRFQTTLTAGALVYWRITALLIAFLIKLLVVFLSPSVGHVVLALAADPLLLAGAHLLAYRTRPGGVWLRPSFEREWLRWFARRAPLVMLAALFGVLYSRGDLLLIDALGATSAQLGWYGAAIKLVLALELIPTLLLASLFPAVWAARGDHALWKFRLQRSFDILLVVALTLSVVVAFSASLWLPLLFGVEFEPSIGLLSVAIWSALFSFGRALIGRCLIADNRLGLSALSQATGVLTCLTANVLLFPAYGIFGAAVASLVTYAISNWLFFFVFPSTRPLAVMLGKSLLIVLRPRAVADIWRSTLTGFSALWLARLPR
jgi:PST family polysaccharide transporter